jgi:hypothetical protein
MRACFPFDHSISLDVAPAVSSLYALVVLVDVMYTLVVSNGLVL